MHNETYNFVIYGMEKLSEYISKNIISLNSGNIIGYVVDVLFDEETKKVSGFFIVDEESEKNMFLDDKHIISKKEECFVISDEKDLETFLFDDSNNPIGKVVYDKQGLNLGRVIDVYIEKNKIEKLVTTKCEIPMRFIEKLGKNCIIYGKNNKKSVKNDIFNKKITINQKIEIQNFEEKKDKEKFKLAPIKMVSNSNMLIGRIATQNILGLNNELIIKENEKVSQKTINKAKIHGKIASLFMFTK